MPKRKLFHIEREILNIIESCHGAEHFIEKIDNAEKLQMVLLPPIDGDDSDEDDASSDCDETSATVRDIGKGILAEIGEIRPVVLNLFTCCCTPFKSPTNSRTPF